MLCGAGSMDRSRGLQGVDRAGAGAGDEREKRRGREMHGRERDWEVYSKSTEGREEGGGTGEKRGGGGSEEGRLHVVR